MVFGEASALAVIVLVGYAVAGLALQHVAYILQYGSLFASVRRWLERKACSRRSPRPLRWACAKLRELVACQVCCITQLALWFCAAPLTALAVSWGGSRPFGLAPGFATWFYVLVALGIAFSTAAVGVMCWDVARMVGRGTEAVILFLRAKKDAAEAEVRLGRFATDPQEEKRWRAAPPVNTRAFG